MSNEDRAQEVELREYEHNQRRAIMPAPHRPSAKMCRGEGCGEPILDARRNAIPGVQFCTECQEFNDFFASQFKKPI